MTIAEIYEDAKRKFFNNEITIGEFAKIVDAEVDMRNGCKGNDCKDCAFENVTGWGFPCCNCSRTGNYKDYWRLKSKESD